MDKLFKQNLLGTFTNVTKYRKCTSLFFSRQVAVNNQHSVHKQCWFTNLKTLTCQREVLYHWTCYFARKSFEITSPHTHTLPENRFVTANVARCSTSFSFWSLVPSVAPAGVHSVVWRSVPTGCRMTRGSVTGCSVPHVSAGTRCLPSLAVAGRFIPTCCCRSWLSTEYQIFNYLKHVTLYIG